MIEMARPVSQQRIQCRDRVWPFGVATQSWCHDRVGLVGGVATSARDKRVLSRQRTFCYDRLYNVFYRDRLLKGLLSRQSFLCRDRAWGWDGEARARATKRSVRTLCTRHTYDCALFGSLFMDTVHKHCSWTLFFKKKKKSTKLTPKKLGRHRYLLICLFVLRYMFTFNAKFNA